MTPGKHIEAGAEVVAVAANGGKAEVSIQMKFRRANGSLISTKIASFTITNEHTISMSEVAPAQAATVDIATGANNSTYWSLSPKFPNWWVLFPGHDDGGTCEQPDCEPCNISCGAGKVPVDKCEAEGFQLCYTIDTCYCGDQEDFESDNQDESLYGPF